MKTISLVAMPSRLDLQLPEREFTLKDAFPNDFREHSSHFSPKCIRALLEEVIRDSECRVTLPPLSEFYQENLQKIFLDIAEQFVIQEGGTTDLALLHIMQLIHSRLDGEVLNDPSYRNYVNINARMIIKLV